MLRVAGVLLALILALLHPTLATGGPRVGKECTAVIEGQAQRISFFTRSRNGDSVPIQGILRKPAGDGPFPAIVMLHRSFGIVPPHCLRQAQGRFVAWGYVALVIDSDSAQDPLRKRLYAIGGYTHSEQAIDAHMGNALLATLPYVRSDRIGVIGYAWGGSATLLAISRNPAGEIQTPRTFQAAVALHPACPAELTGVGAPLLILMGGDDRRNSARACRRMTLAGDRAVEVEKRFYPGRGHNFDAWWERTYDEVATQDAYARIKDFFAAHLR